MEGGNDYSVYFMVCGFIHSFLFTIARSIGILPNFEEKEDKVIQHGEHDFPQI
jgi:hypothetical protein